MTYFEYNQRAMGARGSSSVGLDSVPETPPPPPPPHILYTPAPHNALARPALHSASLACLNPPTPLFPFRQVAPSDGGRRGSGRMTYFEYNQRAMGARGSNSVGLGSVPETPPPPLPPHILYTHRPLTLPQPAPFLTRPHQTASTHAHFPFFLSPFDPD